MEIIGKILVLKPLCKAKIGEVGYVPSSAFRMFKNKLYFLPSVSYFREISGDYNVPFERIGKGKHSFVFDFVEVNVSFANVTEKPKKKEKNSRLVSR